MTDSAPILPRRAQNQNMLYFRRMSLARALRIDTPAPRIAFVGAGGKTTALFQLARELSPTVIATATTHLGAWQISAADHHLVAKDMEQTGEMPAQGVILVTDEFENDRAKPISPKVLDWLREKSKNENIALLIEADGSRQKPVKAPAEHEPPIPNFAESVTVVAGLSALGKPLNGEYVHRAELFSRVSGLSMGETITPEALVRALSHPQGGLKNIPEGARRVVLLNQADSPELESIGGEMARALLETFDAALVGSLRGKRLHTVERCAGIILAAGESKRFGKSKQTLEWKGKPFARHVAETALHGGLDPVIAVTGDEAAQVESALAGLPVQIAFNPDYRQGQSASIKKGLRTLMQNPRFSSVGSAVFLLADQPHLPTEVVRALKEAHGRSLPEILAPLVMEEKRANPVLFDRSTFPDLLALQGDAGGRAIFGKRRVEYLPWLNESLLFDVDSPEDYERLKRER